MMALHLIAALMCVPGFAALALAMERHQEDVFGAALAAGRTRALRVAGWALLLLALVLLVRTQGWSLGLVSFSGHTSFAAALSFLGLIAIERWRLRAQPRGAAR
ncbi:DUF3325 domain-containing protein [Xenophilus arseniciresistens]|uniref:DUF3325 domain-containing protein n=1 Tax=Xenophilus arseniciresistens TaxID=1283306 RepID=A0AAE3N941_9BURK|nr:DUF3325 domain-containing protein [Xenophilus arseniciresistens]MDA7417421.1 DUF3325 domain-containing protein [Xenophilus arseniciresistens]